MNYLEITEKDRLLVQAAIEVVTKNYREERHTVYDTLRRSESFGNVQDGGRSE